MSPKTPPDSWIGTREQFRWLLGIVKVVLALNLLDAIFTLVWINAGLAREANPLLAEIVRSRSQPSSWGSSRAARFYSGAIGPDRSR